MKRIVKKRKEKERKENKRKENKRKEKERKEKERKEKKKNYLRVYVLCTYRRMDLRPLVWNVAVCTCVLFE